MKTLADFRSLLDRAQSAFSGSQNARQIANDELRQVEAELARAEAGSDVDSILALRRTQAAAIEKTALAEQMVRAAQSDVVIHERYTANFNERVAGLDREIAYARQLLNSGVREQQIAKARQQLQMLEMGLEGDRAHLEHLLQQRRQLIGEG